MMEEKLGTLQKRAYKASRRLTTDSSKYSTDKYLDRTNRCLYRLGNMLHSSNNEMGIEYFNQLEELEKAVHSNPFRAYDSITRVMRFARRARIPQERKAVWVSQQFIKVFTK